MLTGVTVLRRKLTVRSDMARSKKQHGQTDRALSKTLPTGRTEARAAARGDATSRPTEAEVEARAEATAAVAAEPPPLESCQKEEGVGAEGRRPVVAEAEVAAEAEEVVVLVRATLRASAHTTLDTLKTYPHSSLKPGKLVFSNWMHKSVLKKILQ